MYKRYVPPPMFPIIDNYETKHPVYTCSWLFEKFLAVWVGKGGTGPIQPAKMRSEALVQEYPSLGR